MTLAFATGQTNFIPNASFENASSCPIIPGWTADSWTAYMGSPDLFSNCSNMICCTTPGNSQGTLAPYDGNNYVGIFNYVIDGGANYTESIYAQLTSPLIAGMRYFFSLKSALSDSCNCASNHLGVNFKVTPNFVSSTFGDSTYYNNTAKISFPKTSNHYWILQSGSFIADSAYKYIYIGNFFRQANMDTLVVRNKLGIYADGGDGQFKTSQCVSYYFIDDLKLSTDSVFTEQTTGLINSGSIPNKIEIYPNPISDVSILQFDNAKKEICALTLYDICGQIKQTMNNITGNQVIIRKNDLIPGMYFFVLRTGDRVIATGKLAMD
ncbi:MAG: T9SS type A sorting domain-containing protein [Bacteroidia bacterium]